MRRYLAQLKEGHLYLRPLTVIEALHLWGPVRPTLIRTHRGTLGSALPGPLQSAPEPLLLSPPSVTWLLTRTDPLQVTLTFCGWWRIPLATW